MLCSVPGLSEERAAAVVKKYPNLPSLMNTYEQITSVEEKEDLLENIDVIKVSHHENKNIKLGKIISKKIFRFMQSFDPDEII